MKLLLTSAGIKNQSIHDALVELLPKPIAECDALCIPTASYGHGSLDGAWRFVARESKTPLTQLEWKSLGLLELTALPTMDKEKWTAKVLATDVLLVGGGDAGYLHHWMRESGLSDLFPQLEDKVYVGISGGSMVMTPRIGPDFMTWQPPSGSDATLGVVDFSIFPHLDHPELDNSMDEAVRWAGELGAEAYAIDDDTAIRVVDGVVDVITEGHWRHFPA